MFINSLRRFRRSLNSMFYRFKWNVFLGCYLDLDVTLGRRVNMERGTRIGLGSYIGQYTYIGPNVTIGKYTMLADNVNIIGFDHEFSIVGKPIMLSGIPASQPITVIGNDVWLGHGVVVMRGCKIGDGAIVGANAVVTCNVEPCAVYVGVPARKIKSRFTSVTECEQHLKLIKSIVEGN